MQELFEYNEKKLNIIHKYRTERSAIAPTSVNLNRIGTSKRQTFINRLSGELSITIYMALKPGNIDNQQRLLADFFEEDEPKKLWFPREADKYYLAIQSGDITYDKSQGYVIATVTMIVPDGVAYATASKDFAFSPNSDGILEATIINDGTDWATVDYMITHNHENGYVGIVSQYGAIELGKKEEVDGVDYQRNEVLHTSGNFSTWADDTGVSIENPDNATNGQLSVTQYNGKPVLSLSNAGTGAGWHGGMKRILFDADSNGHVGANNWDCSLEIVFNSFLPNQTGAITLCLFDKDEKKVAAITIWKTSSGMDAVFSVGSYTGFNKTRSFNSGNLDGVNAFRNDRGWVRFYKMGDEVFAYVFGENFRVQDGNVKNSEVVGAQFYIAQFGSRNTTDQLVSQMFLRKMVFSKVGVDKWRDMPNRYPEGTKIFIDGRSRKPYVNDQKALYDEVFGSQYFKVPPGETKVQLVCSAFSNPLPTAKATIREVWL